MNKKNEFSTVKTLLLITVGLILGIAIVVLLYWLFLILDTTETRTIASIGAVGNVIGGIIGGIVAYIVARIQIDKNIQHEKNKKQHKQISLIKFIIAEAKFNRKILTRFEDELLQRDKTVINQLSSKNWTTNAHSIIELLSDEDLNLLMAYSSSILMLQIICMSGDTPHEDDDIRSEIEYSIEFIDESLKILEKIKQIT